MTKKIKNIKGKIGYCYNKTLGITDRDGKQKNGHYVYIRKVNKDGTCDVSTFTSLEDKISNKKTLINLDRIKRVKYGDVYPIPIKDCNFPHWSGVRNNVIRNVKIKNVHNIGKLWIKKRHIFVIGKNSKKK